MRSDTMKHVVLFVVFAAVITSLCAFVSESTRAQCAMCKASLNANNAAFVRNLNIGVLVLLVPPVSIFCTIFVLATRHRKSS